MVSKSVSCETCGLGRDPNDDTPCPDCGDMRKKIVVSVNEKINLRESLSFVAEGERSILSKKLIFGIMSLMGIGISISFMAGVPMITISGVIASIYGAVIGEWKIKERIIERRTIR